MKLIRSLPAAGGAPELLIFYCSACDQVAGQDVAGPDAPSMWQMGLLA